MDNKNSQSNSNISQRLQIAAERRTQIEEARRERVQRQIEQSPRPTVAAAMNSHGFNQNPSVAFGSTRPRNIDLTRPLVTPIPSARPKSEIFPSTFYAGAAHSGGGGGGSTQVDSSSSAYFSTPLKASSQHVFAKDDANYQPATRSPRTPLQPQQSTTTTPSLMSQSMIVPSSSSSNSGGSSNYRAARRHDPELVPAMQKYIFREYAMPTSASSGTPSLRKENSMISSMMSTKSFQQGPTSSSSFYRTPFGGPQNRPKKSYSMNRLDQLAQPRRRVEPKVPTSASFVRPKMEPFTPSSKKPAPATEGGEGRVKPIPPPKTLFKSPRPQTAAAEPSSTSSPSAAAAATPAVPSRSRPATTPKPRPLSQIELSSTQSAAASAEEAANAAANEGEKEFEGSADDRLAEYKRALAEKRAMFRKQQEEQQLLQQQNPVRKAKIVKPEPAPVVAESEESKKAASSSSSSSSSSSEASDNEADNEDDEHKQQQNKPESVSTAVAAAAAPLSVELAQVSSEEAKKTASEAVPAPSQTSSVTESANVNSEQLISFGDSSPSAASPQVPPPRDVMTGDMMSTSLTGDLAALAINSGANSSRSEMAEKALAVASMTASLDLSLLNENKPGFSGNSKAGATTFTKEQLEERSAQLLQQQMAEREKRKSRVQEILKRTRKDEKAKEGASKQTDSNGSNGDSSQSENEANNGNNSDEASNEQAPVGTSSGGAEDGSSGSKFNGHNGESSGKATTADNGHSNGHLGSNHHRDMKTFVSENEQSLPPTNGF